MGKKYVFKPNHIFEIKICIFFYRVIDVSNHVDEIDHEVKYFMDLQTSDDLALIKESKHLISQTKMHVVTVHRIETTLEAVEFMDDMIFVLQAYQKKYRNAVYDLFAAGQK